MLRCALRAWLCCQEMGFPPDTNHCSLLQKGSTVTASQHELCKKGEATQTKGCLVLGSASRELLERCHCLQGATLCSIRTAQDGAIQAGNPEVDSGQWVRAGAMSSPTLTSSSPLPTAQLELLICNAVRPTYCTACELLLGPFYSPSCLGREHAFGFMYAVVSLFLFFILFFFFFFPSLVKTLLCQNLSNNSSCHVFTRILLAARCQTPFKQYSVKYCVAVLSLACHI